MSYSIFYSRIVVKINDNLYSPFILAGDSNVYEQDNRTRPRRWSFFSYVTQNKVCVSRAELEVNYGNELAARIASNPECSADEIKRRYRYYASVALYGRKTLSFHSYTSFILNALNKALPIEELLRYGVYLQLQVSYYDYEKLRKAGLEIKDPVTITSSGQFNAMTFVWQQYYGKLFQSTWLMICGDSGLDMLVESMRSRRIKKPKQYKEVDQYFVLEYQARKVYFIRALKHGFRYVTAPQAAKKFETEQAATRFRNKSIYKHDFTVTKIPEKGII